MDGMDCGYPFPPPRNAKHETLPLDWVFRFYDLWLATWLAKGTKTASQLVCGAKVTSGAQSWVYSCVTLV